ncbi:MAG: CZB domain-containing protein [Nitrosomonadales bacterium]|nr:CZB domain-containing protein [Nitrosomonadales bacterium]
MASVPGVNSLAGFGLYPRREMRDRYNLIAAAEAHVLWKAHLGHHVRGTIREPLESALIGQDGICQLGNWIRGSVFKPFRETEAYRQLNEAHLQFHEMGRNIVEHLKRGDRKGAEALFDNEYSLALRRILQSLTEINRLLYDI